MKRVGLALAALIGLCLVSPAQAQDKFPSKPIKVILPYTAGSPNDVIARVIGPVLSGRLGQPLVVDNRPGGGTAIGLKAVMSSEADGHTFVAEVRHLLQLVLFVYDEVVLAESGDEASVLIDDSRRDVDEVDAAFETKFFLILPRDARTAGDDGHGERCRETDRGAQHMFHGRQPLID